MIKKLLHIISSIISFIITLLLLVILVAWLQVKVFDMKYANIFGFTMFEVVTGSMSGTIEIDDYVIVKETTDINVKDIITFQDGNSFVTHRVVEIRGDKIITRGDANNSDDKEITYDDIVGKVIHVLPGAGVWKSVLLEKQVFIPIIITLVLFVVFFSIEEKKYREVVKKGNLDALNSLIKEDKKDDNTKKVKEVKVKARLDMLKNEEESKDK